jgi:Uma2 family endonuclease
MRVFHARPYFAIEVLAAGTARKRPEKVKEYLRRMRTSLTPLSSDTGPKPIGD